MDNSLTDIELKVFFDRMFPNGFAGTDVLNEIAPEGWRNSPLLACFHPSPEQVYEECVRMHRNIHELICKKNTDKVGPEDLEPTLEKIRAEWTETPIKLTDEVTELVGCCIWDIFSDNHEVVVADGRVVDIGSFRGAGAFIDGYLSGKENMDLWNGDYLNFYLGTLWMNVRADLKVVYAMIFRRLKSIGADWVYHFPELNFIELSQLHENPESPIAYSPSDAWMAQQAEEQHEAEVEKMRIEFTEMNAQSRKEAMDRPIPSTVNAYREVYGCNPCGWPPDQK